VFLCARILGFSIARPQQLVPGLQRRHDGRDRGAGCAGEHWRRILEQRPHERCVDRRRHRLTRGAMVIDQLHWVRAHPFSDAPYYLMLMKPF